MYRADTEYGEPIVLKLLKIESREGAKRAEREIEAMNRIDHENMVDLVDAYQKEVQGEIFLVILEEYIEGNTLKEVIDDGVYNIELGVMVLESLLEVLCEFEEESIVHRDIKPANIMIGPKGDLTLLDVGIARFLSKSTLTPSFRPHAPGTYPYSAPEQLENEKELQDIRTDLFSTGIVFYESTVGNHPFDVAGFSIPRAIMMGEKEKLELNDLNNTDASKIANIYDKLTSHEPYQRPRKPEFVLEELGELTEGDLNV